MQLTPALGFIDILRGAGEGGIVSQCLKRPTIQFRFTPYPGSICSFTTYI